MSSRVRTNIFDAVTPTNEALWSIFIHAAFIYPKNMDGDLEFFFVFCCFFFALSVSRLIGRSEPYDSFFSFFLFLFTPRVSFEQRLL